MSKNSREAAEKHRRCVFANGADVNCNDIIIFDEDFGINE